MDKKIDAAKVLDAIAEYLDVGRYELRIALIYAANKVGKKEGK